MSLNKTPIELPFYWGFFYYLSSVIALSKKITYDISDLSQAVRRTGSNDRRANQ